MLFGGRTFRAFRPSLFGRPDDQEDYTDQAKQALIRSYAERARVGLPLFESSEAPEGLTSGQDLVVM